MNINSKGSGNAVAATAIDVRDREEASGISLNHLPDEILLLIFNRLCDLKCLCYCSLVSPRFSSLVFHVHSVSFSVLPQPNPDNPSEKLSTKLRKFFVNAMVAKPLQIFRPGPNPLHPVISSFNGDSFPSAVYFLTKFKAIRSLHIVLPSSPHKSINVNDSNSLFNWTAKFSPTNIQSFIFLSRTSISRGESQFEERQGQEESRLPFELLEHKLRKLLKDAISRHRMLLFFVGEHPILQNITITDSEKQGTLCLRGEKLVQMRNWIDSASTEVKSQLNWSEFPAIVKQWHVPVLKLPVSRQVMEGATLVLLTMNDFNGSRYYVDGAGDVAALVDVFEQGEEEPFAEAVVEMMVNHKIHKSRDIIL